MTTVLRSLDSMHNTGFGVDDVQDWPENALDLLVSSGILRKSGYADSIVCHECEECCSVEVHFDDGDDGLPTRAFYDCPLRDDIRRIRIPIERLETWALSSTALASALAESLGTGDDPAELATGRLWSLGKVVAGCKRFDMFLARGARWPDASALFRSASGLKQRAFPVVLVPGKAGSGKLFGTGAREMSLESLLSIGSDGLSFDLEGLKETLAAGTGVEKSADVFHYSPGFRCVSLRGRCCISAHR